jgi:nucleotide-binding universal stress UspA family protein
MKRSHFLMSALALCLAAPAFADGGPYPEPAVPTTESTKTRAQVAAEALEARRLGLITTGEEDIRIATPEQEQLIAEAGRRAAEKTMLASQHKRGEKK